MHDKIKELRFNTKLAQDFYISKLAYTVGANELKNLMGNIVLLDIRNSKDYNAGHIPSAISIPKEELDKNLDKLSKDKLTVVYGCSEYCSGALYACVTLTDYDYPCVLLRGGFRAWSEYYRYTVVQDMQNNF